MAADTIVYYVLVSGFSDVEVEARRALIGAHVPADFRLEIASDPESPAWAATSDGATSGLARYVSSCDPTEVAAVVVSGALDPGLHDARPVSRVPLVGPGEASLALAAAIHCPLSLLVIDEPTAIAARAMVERPGTRPPIASIRSTGTPAAELMADPDRTCHALAREARAAVEQDGAGALLLACMLFSGLDVAATLRAELGVPVIDPLPVAMATAVACARAGAPNAERVRTS